MKHLVLFDIDGTLLSTRWRSVKAMMIAYADVYGRDPSGIDYRMDGKTDLQITYELMALAGVDRATVTGGLSRFWPRYEEEMQRMVTADSIKIFPGVREAVTAIGQSSHMLMGLLTGNFENGARIKLAAAGLDGFALGAFGGLHEDRAQLPALAVDKAEQVSGKRFTGKQIVIIGDTPNDILCGRALNAKSIAVATGRYTLDDLAAHTPDFVFKDLSDLPALLRAVEA